MFWQEHQHSWGQVPWRSPGPSLLTVPPCQIQIPRQEAREVQADPVLLALLFCLPLLAFLWDPWDQGYPSCRLIHPDQEDLWYQVILVLHSFHFLQAILFLQVVQ